MATNKNRVQAYISNDLQQMLDGYCSSNGNISQSKAIEMILETFFFSEKKAVLGTVDKVIDKAIDDCLAGTESPNTVARDELDRVIDSKLAPLLDRVSHLESLIEELGNRSESPSESPSELLSESPSELLGELDSGLGITDTDSLDNSLESHSESPEADVELDEVNPISEPQKTFSVNEVSSDSGWSSGKIYREIKISNLEKRELLIPSYDYSRAFKLIGGTKPYSFTEIPYELFQTILT